MFQARTWICEEKNILNSWTIFFKNAWQKSNFDRFTVRNYNIIDVISLSSHIWWLFTLLIQYWLQLYLKFSDSTVFQYFFFQIIEMKIFQSIRKSFEILGLNPPNSIKRHSYNARNLITIFVLSVLTIGTNMFLLFYAKTFKELTDSFYTACSSALTVLSFVNMIPKMRKVYELLENFEKLISKSKEKHILNIWKKISIGDLSFSGTQNPVSKAIFQETTKQMEKLCEVAHFTMMTISLPCIMYPKLLISFFIYFTNDFDKSAFELPFPMW